LAKEELAIKSRQRTVSHHIAVASHPPYFSPNFRLKTKLKGRHFDTTEVMEAESQAVLNSLTEVD
jgi:hypothetical protein